MNVVWAALIIAAVAAVAVAAMLLVRRLVDEALAATGTRLVPPCDEGGSAAS